MLVRDPTDKLTVQYNPAQLGLIAAHLNKVALAQGDSFLTSPYFGPERAMMFRMLAGRGDQHTAAFFHHEIAEVIATTNLGGDRLSPGRAFLQTQAQAHYDVIRAQGHSTLPRQGLFLRYHPAVVLAFPDFFN
ncbi:MAG: hypothetical protein HKP37_10100 [Boseongicola sp.]|nr:hypothetical protein [Boseongicola sp.]